MTLLGRMYLLAFPRRLDRMAMCSTVDVPCACKEAVKVDLLSLVTSLDTCDYTKQQLLGLVTSLDTCDFASQVPISDLWTLRSVTSHV